MEQQTQSNETARVDPTRWVDEHGDCLFRFALVRVRDPSIAQDLVQETFLAALKAQDKFEGKSSEQSWLVGILKHKIIDYIRKASRERAQFADEPLPRQVAEQMDEGGHWRVFDGFGPKEWAPDAAAAFQQKEFWSVLDNCLSKLQPRTAQAFVLREMEDVDSKEICGILAVTESNLWVLLHRARAQLRLCIEVNWFGQTAKAGELPRWLKELKPGS